MIKKILLIAIIISSTAVSYAQSNINEYKYVIVPNKFEFLKEVNEYRLNVLTKILLEKYDFQTLMEGEDLPEDLDNNICLALKADVLNNSGAFKTKLTIQLKNCKGDIIYTSKEGMSREKKYAVAFDEALRDAFKSFETLNYKYKPITVLQSASITEKGIENKQEIEQLKQEIKALKEEKKTIAQTKTEVEPIKVEEENVTEIKSTATNVLYAQKIDNGFQLVDQIPKIVYSIKNTGLNNVFLVEGKEAIIYKIDANWVLEFYENSELKTKLLNIKF